MLSHPPTSASVRCSPSSIPAASIAPIMLVEHAITVENAEFVDRPSHRAALRERRCLPQGSASPIPRSGNPDSRRRAIRSCAARREPKVRSRRTRRARHRPSKTACVRPRRARWESAYVSRVRHGAVRVLPGRVAAGRLTLIQQRTDRHRPSVRVAVVPAIEALEILPRLFHRSWKAHARHAVAAEI